MDLTILLETASAPAGDRHAFAFVIAAEPDARRLHEDAAVLDDPDATPHTAAYAALLAALEHVARLEAESVRFLTGSPRLANQLTGAEPVETPDEQAAHERAMMALLRLDGWAITHADRDALRHARDHAEAALATGDDAPAPPPATFTVELLDEPGPDCHARCRAGIRFAFGPDTPGGLCLHAAETALAHGPHHDPDAAPRELTTTCTRCGVKIQIRRTD